MTSRTITRNGYYALLATTAISVLWLPTLAFAAPQSVQTGDAAGGKATSEAVLQRAQARWADAIRKVRPPATGCATAKYPVLQWQPTACTTAPNTPFPPGKRPEHPFQVGGGGANDMAPRTNPVTTSAEGTFTSVSAGISENGLVGNPGVSQTDAYSLQLNTNMFSPSAGCTAGSGPTCQGWEQFIYENNDTSHSTFIQYWLIAFNHACPSGWGSYPYPTATDISCYINSAAVAVGADQPVSNLGSLVLKGEATASSDRVTLTVGGVGFTTPGINAVGLASGWTDSEFNIVGDGNGYDATFGANTTLRVRTLVHNGTTAAPICVLESFTGETNNLTMSGASSAGPLPSPGVEFTETNLPGTAAQCIGASGIGDTHLRTFTGLLYDFQATGDFILAETGNFQAQTRQISGKPNWPDAAVNQAVAARLGKFNVALCSSSEAIVMIDNEMHNLQDGQIVDLGDGSGIKREGNFVILVDPDGNSLSAELLGNRIDATVGLGKWPTRVRGLLASTGRTNTILTGRDGKTYAAPYKFATFYGKYGESWRVPKGKSLLDACGPSLENGQPKAAFTVRRLNVELLRQARSDCLKAGVKGKALLEACTLDVAVLHDKNAAKAFLKLPAPTAVGLIN